MQSKVYTIEYKLNNEINSWECTVYTMDKFIEEIRKKGAKDIKKIPHEKKKKKRLTKSSC